MNLPESKLIKTQVKRRVASHIKIDGELCDVYATIRYDDKCGNGHNSFAITGGCYRAGRAKIDRNVISCGCIHDIIAVAFPDLKPYLKWHLTTSDGPMHYVANSVYHASDKDHNGLRKGEFQSFTYRVMVNEKYLYQSRIFYSFRNWLHRDEAKGQADEFIKNIKPELHPEIIQAGSGEPSKGRQPNLEAARSNAVWPEAELSDFTESSLRARLPSLMKAFKRDMTTLGFEY